MALKFATSASLALMLSSQTFAADDHGRWDSSTPGFNEKIKELVMNLPNNLGACEISAPEFSDNLGMFKNESAVVFNIRNINNDLEMVLPVPLIESEKSYLTFIDFTAGEFLYRSNMITKWSTTWRSFDYEIKGTFDNQGIKTLTATKYVFEPRNEALGLPGYWYREEIGQENATCVRQ